MVNRALSKGHHMVRSRLMMGIAAGTAVAVGAVGGALLGVPGLSGAQPFPQSAVQVAATNAAKPNVGPGKGAVASPLIAAAAKALNLTPQQLLQKLSDGKTTIADVAKQQGVDINTVIAAMTSADQDRISKIVNNPWPQFGAGKGFAGTGGPGPATAPGAAAGPAFGGRFGLGLGRIANLALDPAAKALGITTDQLKTDLANGQTIAQIAKSKNVDVNTVINALVAAASAKIDAAVTAGHLSTAQAAKVKAALTKGITDLVNNGFPKGPNGGPFGGMGRGHFPGPKGGSSTPRTTAAKAPTA